VSTLGINPAGKTLRDLYNLANEKPRLYTNKYANTTLARRNSSGNPEFFTGSAAGWSGAVVPAIVASPWDAARKAAQYTATGAGTFYIFGGNSADSFSAGDIITCSAKVILPVGSFFRVNVHSMQGNIYFLGNGGTGLAPIDPAPADGLPFRVSATATINSDVAANFLALAIIIYSTAGAGALGAGSVVSISDHMVEKTDQSLPYFSGANAADSNYNYSWQGAAGISPSLAIPK
jgi:hypothetical protein